MNCAKCKHHEQETAEDKHQVTYIACPRFEPRGAANNPKITINLSAKTGVTWTVENVGQNDAYSLLQGCWLAAGEMFQLLSSRSPRK